MALNDPCLLIFMPWCSFSLQWKLHLVTCFSGMECGKNNVISSVRLGYRETMIATSGPLLCSLAYLLWGNREAMLWAALCQGTEEANSQEELRHSIQHSVRNWILPTTMIGVGRRSSLSPHPQHHHSSEPSEETGTPGDKHTFNLVTDFDPKALS